MKLYSLGGRLGLPKDRLYGCGNPGPKWIRRSDCPTPSESLRLHYTSPLSYTNRYQVRSTMSSENIPLQNVLEFLRTISELTRVDIGKDRSLPLYQLKSPRRLFASYHLVTLLVVDPTSLEKCLFYEYIFKSEDSFTPNFS